MYRLYQIALAFLLVGSLKPSFASELAIGASQGSENASGNASGKGSSDVSGNVLGKGSSKGSGKVKESGSPLSIENVEIKQIEVAIKDIYQGEDNHWMHDFANDYKVATKEYVVINRLPFKLGDKVSLDEIKEAERILRNLPYLRDAMITLSSDGLLSVVVIDNWTLFPNISFGRKGGQSKYSVGIRDSNILGLGIAATLAYRTDAQKKGYRLRVTSPVGLFRQDLLNIILEDYDTGKTSQLSFEKPFYTLNSKSMFYFSSANKDIAEVFYQNGEQLGVYDSEHTKFNHRIGWLSSKSSNQVTRNMLGVVSEKININDASYNLYGGLEKASEKWFIWWGQEVVESDFKVEKNINFISSKEDINFGAEFSYAIGAGKSEYDNLGTESLLMLSSKYSKTIKYNELLNFNKVNFYTELTKSQDYVSLGHDFNIFYPLTDSYLLYFASHYSYVSQYRLTPNSVGGDSYLRGFPLQYQHGKQTWTKNLELRHYSDDIVFKSFAVGWSLFVDAGKAWDNFEEELNVIGGNNLNLENKTLYSMGVGARFYSLVSSGKEVIHVDLVKPFTRNKEIDGWEWRISSKKTF